MIPGEVIAEWFHYHSQHLKEIITLAVLSNVQSGENKDEEIIKSFDDMGKSLIEYCYDREITKEQLIEFIESRPEEEPVEFNPVCDEILAEEKQNHECEVTAFQKSFFRSNSTQLKTLLSTEIFNAVSRNLASPT